MLKDEESHKNICLISNKLKLCTVVEHTSELRCKTTMLHINEPLRREASELLHDRNV
jgi:hypothetical protein